MTRFSVIACDQFTSQIEYWNDLKVDDWRPTHRPSIWSSPKRICTRWTTPRTSNRSTKRSKLYLRAQRLGRPGRMLHPRRTPNALHETAARLDDRRSTWTDYTYEKGLRTLDPRRPKPRFWNASRRASRSARTPASNCPIR
ncbi:MAG: hypothetical protein MZU97_26670 [Bacillus subtilis]|nr:hypothetical protein [Bacillus subtilis]